MPDQVDEHDWHPFDTERGLEVRQRTGGDQPNRWEVRDTDGRTVELDDSQFDRLRSEPGWLPEGLR